MDSTTSIKIVSGPSSCAALVLPFALGIACSVGCMSGPQKLIPTGATMITSRETTIVDPIMEDKDGKLVKVPGRFTVPANYIVGPVLDEDLQPEVVAPPKTEMPPIPPAKPGDR